MGDTFARGGSFHTFRLIRPDQSEYAISKKGPHFMGDRLFVTPADGSSIGLQVDDRQTVTRSKINTSRWTTARSRQTNSDRLFSVVFCSYILNIIAGLVLTCSDAQNVH